MFKKMFMSLALSLFLAAGFNVAGFTSVDTLGLSSAWASADDDKKKELEKKEKKEKEKKEKKENENKDNLASSSSISCVTPYPAGLICVCDTACHPMTPGSTLASKVKSDEDQLKSDQDSKTKDEKAKSDHEKEKEGHKKDKKDHEDQKAIDENSGDNNAVTDDDNNIKADDDKIKADDDKIKADDDKIKADDDKIKADDDTLKSDSNDLDTETSAYLNANAVSCTCINGSSGYLLNSSGPGAGANPAGPGVTLTTPPLGNGSSNSGSSFREISGQ